MRWHHYRICSWLPVLSRIRRSMEGLVCFFTPNVWWYGLTTLGSCSPHHFESLTRLPCMLHTTISTRCHTFHAESYLLLRGCLLQGADAGPTLHFITRVGGDDDSRVGRRWLKLNRARTRGASQGLKAMCHLAVAYNFVFYCQKHTK